MASRFRWTVVPHQRLIERPRLLVTPRLPLVPLLNVLPRVVRTLFVGRPRLCTSRQSFGIVCSEGSTPRTGNKLCTVLDAALLLEDKLRG